MSIGLSLPLITGGPQPRNTALGGLDHMASFINSVDGKRIPGGYVSYMGTYNVMAELKKAAKGKKTAVPLSTLLLQVTEGYPVIQKRIKKAFSTTWE
jgi:hypothetical protein